GRKTNSIRKSPFASPRSPARTIEAEVIPEAEPNPCRAWASSAFRPTFERLTKRSDEVKVCGSDSRFATAADDCRVTSSAEPSLTFRNVRLYALEAGNLGKCGSRPGPSETSVAPFGKSSGSGSIAAATGVAAPAASATIVSRRHRRTVGQRTDPTRASDEHPCGIERGAHALGDRRPRARVVVHVRDPGPRPGEPARLPVEGDPAPRGELRRCGL